MFYTDIHCHMLSCVDDGASTTDEMFGMLAMAYENGTRRVCLTPHCQPAFFGDTSDAAQASYRILQAYAAEKFPDMQLSLASELGYFSEWRKELESGRCRLIGGKFLLMDFPADVTLFALRYALEDVTSCGIPVVLAHVERYVALRGEYDMLRDFTRRGVYYQLNASAFQAKLPRQQRSHIKKIIAKCPVAAVASDAHGLDSRLPVLQEAHDFISMHYEEELADLLLSVFPSLLFEGKDLR